MIRIAEIKLPLPQAEQPEQPLLAAACGILAVPADAIARAIAYAVEQPADVDVSELIVRPTASPF